MSIIDDMLILVEDAGRITVEESCEKMKTAKRQIISSTLGRLTAKGYIKKTSEKNIQYFSITDSGHKLIDSELEYLKYIKQDIKQDNWLILIFNIPEKQRKYRDELRRQLVKLGFGRLHDSIWFSKQNLKEKINELVSINSLQKNIITIETKKFSDIENKQLMEKLNWNWEELNKKYETYIENANNFLSQKEKIAFQAKQLVYQLAKILKEDPKLPDYTYPKNYQKNKAIELYNKIRPYCYN